MKNGSCPRPGRSDNWTRLWLADFMPATGPMRPLTVHICPVSPHQYSSVHAGAQQSQGPQVKSCRYPVLTSPGSRRQSRRCRSVHRPYAETSIRCSPVHGARAPTEHPNPTSSAIVCRLWTLWPSRRASGTVEPQNTRTTAPVLANRMPSDQRKPLVPEHPPITHRLPATDSAECAPWRRPPLARPTSSDAYSLPSAPRR
jgi:hypothetical protein